MATPVPLQVRKQQLVRDAIWDAAADLFAAKGFDETTVDDIAAAAGVSRRSFFRYFSSKSDLLGQGVVHYGSELAEAIEACPAASTPLEVVRETVLRVAERSAARERTKKAMEIVLKYPAARAAEVSRLPEVQDLVAAAFARRRGRGSKDDLTPKLLAGLTLHALGVVFLAWHERGQADIRAVAEQVFAALERLVCEGAAGRGKGARGRVAGHGAGRID